MPLTTAQQLVEAGYLRSTANDPGKLAVDGELLPFLNRKYQAYFALAAAQAPDAYTTWTTVQLLGADRVADLPQDIIALRSAFDANGGRVNIIPVTERDRSWHLAPCVFRRATFIQSRARTGDPLQNAVLTLDTLLAPIPLTVLSSTVDSRWPVRFDELLVLDIAVYLSAKDENRSIEDYKKLMGEKNDLMAIFMRLNGITTNEASPHDRSIPARETGER